MDYDQFRALFEEALSAAGLMPSLPRPQETLSLEWMSRAYKTIVVLGAQQTRPFHVTATLNWEWSAALAARGVTTEEDLLTELLGQDGYDLVTEQPWLRVDVTLNATLPRDAPLPMPDSGDWRRWATEVVSRLASLLPTDSEEDEGGLRILSWRGEPEARLECDSDGNLFLTRGLSIAWQGIKLPRQWDNPDREPDPWLEEQLANLAGRVRQALMEWEECLRYLPATA
jgi:hypothetical protein